MARMWERWNPGRMPIASSTTVRAKPNLAREEAYRRHYEQSVRAEAALKEWKRKHRGQRKQKADDVIWGDTWEETEKS